MRSIRVLVSILLLITVTGLVVTRRAASQDEPIPAKPYTFVAVERMRGVDGKLSMATITFEVAAAGTWVSTRETRDKTELTTVGTDYQVNRVGEQEGPKRQFPEQGADEIRAKFRSTSFLRQHRSFVRTDTVCGLVGYVLKGGFPNAMEFERTYTPETGYLAVRVHEHHVNPPAV
jgi:hypothetical protein